MRDFVYSDLNNQSHNETIKLIANICSVLTFYGLINGAWFEFQINNVFGSANEALRFRSLVSFQGDLEAMWIV